MPVQSIQDSHSSQDIALAMDLDTGMDAMKELPFLTHQTVDMLHARQAAFDHSIAQ
jgi:hypothetical protein